MQTLIRSVPRHRLHQGIVEQFLALIRQGVLKHGERLPSEREMAQRFKVSRSSVREAIRQLELQGVVVSRPGSGTFVDTESLDSVVTLIASTLISGVGTQSDIFEMRRILEPQIAALAAERATPEEVQRLREILEAQEGQIAAGDSGVEADTVFHFTLVSATHNSALVKVVSAVEDILKLSRDQSMQGPGRPRRSLSSHRRILKMIEAGDGAGARQAMEHHLTSVEPATLNRPLAISGQPQPYPGFTAETPSAQRL